MSTKRSHGRARTIVTWVLRVVLAGMFLFSGGMKLAAAPEMYALFEDIGIGQWFRYLTGGLEVFGGIGLLLPRLAGPAALGLSAVMVGAIFTHVAVVGGSVLSPLVLLAMAVVLAWLRFDDTTGLLRAVSGRPRRVDAGAESAGRASRA